MRRFVVVAGVVLMSAVFSLQAFEVYNETPESIMVSTGQSGSLGQIILPQGKWRSGEGQDKCELVLLEKDYHRSVENLSRKSIITVFVNLKGETVARVCGGDLVIQK